MIKLREADRGGLVPVDDRQRMALLWLWHKTNTNPLVRTTHTRTHTHWLHFDATFTRKQIQPLQTEIFFAVSSSFFHLRGRFWDFFIRFHPESTAISLLAFSTTHPALTVALHPIFFLTLNWCFPKSFLRVIDLQWGERQRCQTDCRGSCWRRWVRDVVTCVCERMQCRQPKVS